MNNQRITSEAWAAYYGSDPRFILPPDVLDIAKVMAGINPTRLVKHD